MIRDLDDSVKAMLTGEAATGSELKSVPISFAVPDTTWRGQTNTLALNAYLYEIGQNRELRSNERRMRVQNGNAMVEPYPARVQCTYLITAWNLATAVSGVEQVLQEHRLLSQVLAVVLRNPVIPRKYLKGLLAGQEMDVPLVSTEEGGPAISSDFWTGLDTPVRPALACRVTIALKATKEVSGPMMTSARVAANGDERIVIGGTVFDENSSDALAGAWVRLDETGAEAITDGGGRFRFDGLAPGAYTLTARAPGYKDGGGPVTVPAPSGLYDLKLDPL